MSPLLKRHFFIAIAAAALLVGCSSGGESGTGAQASNQTTVGEVTGFGSVYVNGIKFSTYNTTFTVNGQPATESDLAVGMIVKVVGGVYATGTTGIATEIQATTQIKGLVAQNNVAADGVGDLVVWGQTININNDTQFDNDVDISTIDQLTNSHTVEVSGYADGQGAIYATNVKVISNSGAAMEVQLVGKVTNLNTSALTFDIGSMSVSYTSANFSGMTAAQLQDGLWVEVEASNINSATPTEIIADEIEAVDLSEDTDTEMEVEGVVTDTSNITSNQFELNGRIVKFDGATQFEGGDQNTIQVDVKLEVDGSVQTDGSILADEISFREESDTELRGFVESVGSNTFVLLGQTIYVNELTRYEDGTGMNNKFHFNALIQGIRVEAKVYVDPDTGNLVATSIEKDENQGEIQAEVEGIVDSVTTGVNTTLTLQGMSSLTINIDCCLPFTGGNGSEVEIRGNYNNLTLMATELSY